MRRKPYEMDNGVFRFRTAFSSDDYYAVNRSERRKVRGMCGCITVMFLLNLILGGVSFNYLLMELFGKSLPFVVATIASVFTGPISISGAAIVYILKLFGIM